MRTATKRLLILAGFASIPCLLLAAALWAPPRWLLVRVDPRMNSDFIVVPGGVESRARFAARCFHEGIAPRILVAGYDDAYTNRDLLVQLGVPSQAISVEPLSRSTVQNARFCAPILRKAGAQTVTIVTSQYHSSRAWETFHHELPEITFISLPVDARFDRDAYDRDYARWEVIKKIWYCVRYRIPTCSFQNYVQ